ncbi:hypothetical protein EJB05_53099, partial [Eragrostis curvula]
MAGSKVLRTYILIFIIVSSSQAEARRLMEAASNGMTHNDAVVEGDGSFRAKQEMATPTSSGQGGYETMQMTTTDSRPTAPVLRNTSKVQESAHYKTVGRNITAKLHRAVMDPNANVGNMEGREQIEDVFGR